MTRRSPPPFLGLTARSTVSNLTLALTLLLVGACAARSPQSSTPSEGAAQATKGLLFQPVLSRVGQEAAAQGTGFFVLGKGGQAFGVTSAHFLGYDGPAITRVDLREVTGDRLLASATHSWGRPGSGGIDDPVVDLGDDLLVLPLTELPASVEAVRLPESFGAPVGTRVWLPNKDPSQPSGYERLEGVVTASTLGCVTVRIEPAFATRSQSGSPVLSVEDGTLVGVLSRAKDVQGGTELELTPGHYVTNAVAEQQTFALERVAGAGGLGEAHKLSFAWPEAQSLHIAKTQRDDEDGKTGRDVSGSYVLDVRAHPEGRLISIRDFKLANASNVPEAQRASVERMATLVPPMVIDPQGAFVRLDHPEPILAALMEALGPMPEEQKKIMASTFTVDTLAAFASSEWSQQVSSWAGQELELSAVYLNEREGPSPIGGAIVKTFTYLSATHRTACSPDDAARSCLALWMLIQADPKATKAIMREMMLKAVPEDRRAEAEAALENMHVESTLRMALVSDPNTLIPVHQVREKLVAMPGSPADYQLREERLLKREPLAPQK